MCILQCYSCHCYITSSVPFHFVIALLTGTSYMIVTAKVFKVLRDKCKELLNDTTETLYRFKNDLISDHTFFPTKPL